MKKITQNSFGKGLNMDLNPLTTPKDVLTDCLNGTVVSYNGDEFSLQTDMGNSRATIIGVGDSNDLPNGFIPLGMKEFNNILYIVAHNPITKESRVGSFPAPQRYLPVHNRYGDNLITKTVYHTNGTSIWELTKELTAPGQINHGMNLLTDYVKRGDKYKISLSLKGIENTATANDILKKFINNYHPTGEGVEGYFDLKYYTFNADGILKELPINIYPNMDSKVSDIAYSPDPFNNEEGSVNGSVKVMDKEGNNVIVAAFIPKSIEAFDFKLKGYNNNDILRARIVFDNLLIIDGNSAIKVHSIKIATKNTKPSGEISEVTTSYYDYKTYKDDLQEIIIENIDGSSFEEGTLISVTCTPIDQFGRELTDKAVTKVYEVASMLLGTEAHDLFKYKVVGNILTLDYNFLNDLPGITNTNIEFYDFWSGVSKVIKNIAFTTDRDTTIEVTLDSTMPTTTVFTPGDQYGGIPADSLRLPTTEEHVLGTHVLLDGVSIRANHCYLVRIYGVDNNIEYSVFQMLYTLPIPIFMDSYLTTRNFSVIDIVEGMVGKQLSSEITGEIFYDYPTSVVIDWVTTESVVSNYADESKDISMPYRLYGGPVFEEEENGITASWDKGDSYYRNVYTKSFAKAGNLETLGYHEFPESAVTTLLSGNDPNGIELPVELFSDQSKNYLRGGLRAPATSSQKDFKFKLISSVKGVLPLLEGTVVVLPSYKEGEDEIPLLFGNIDMSILTKKVKLGDNIIDANTVLNITNGITEDLQWTAEMEDPIHVHSAKMNVEIQSSDIIDTFAIKNFELQSQRYIYGDSGFKYYLRKFSRNKLFRYFSIKHTQTMQVKVVLDGDYTNLSNHLDYIFYGGMDSNVGVRIGTIQESPEYGVMSKYKLVSSPYPDFEATLVWWTDPTLGKIPEAIGGMGVTTTIPLGASSYTNLNARINKNNTKILKFLSYGSSSNTVEQYIYKTFKSNKPTHVKVGIDDTASPLYVHNNLWKWNDVNDPFVAVIEENTQDYLSNLILYQNYQEIIVGQFPKTNIIYNTVSSSGISLEDNHLEYSIKVSQPENEKHLTKSCFGTSVMESFSKSKFSSIIDKWKNRYGVEVKTIYDFTNISISEGYAKNIPWTFDNRLLNTTSIADINLTIDAPTPEEHVNWFTNAEDNLNKSSYLVSSPAVTPTIKAIINGVPSPIKTDFILTEGTSPADNINKSAIVIPMFNKPVLLTKSQPITNSYDVKYKLVDPPTIKQIYEGITVEIGDTYVGGIVFKIYRNAAGAVIGGLVAAKDYIPTTSYAYMTRIDDEVGHTIQSDSEDNGRYNTELLEKHVNTRTNIVSVCTSYAGGGYEDWYLPSLREMEMLLTYSASLETPLLLNGSSYWTSTEYRYNEAWRFNAAKNWSGSPQDKEKLSYAHPIRKF